MELRGGSAACREKIRSNKSLKDIHLIPLNRTEMFPRLLRAVTGQSGSRLDGNRADLSKFVMAGG
jgi:hypothetical protein